MAIQKWTRHPLAAVVLSIAVWSLALNIVALGSTAFVAPQPHPGRAATSAAWQQWDANWFERIVADGYRSNHQQPEPPGIYLRPAFYPGYPLLARGVYEVLHPVGVGITGAMLITNQLLVFPLGVLLYLLVVALTSSTALAVRTVQYLLFFPFAYFLLAPYSEALFLTCIAGFAWALTTRRYSLAAVFGAIATATRLEGVILPAIFLLGYLEQHNWRVRAIKPRIMALALAPFAGAIGYAVYQWIEFGTPTYSGHVERIGWARTFTLKLWQMFKQTFHPFLSAGKVAGVPVEVFIIFPLMVGFAFLTWKVWQRFGLALAVMCALFLLLPLLSGDTLSFNRYVLPLIPCFAILAAWGRRPSVDFAYRTIGGMSLALFLVMFTHGIWTG